MFFRASISDPLEAKLKAAEQGLDEPAMTGVHAKMAAAWANRNTARFKREVGPDLLPWKKSQRVLEKGGRTLFLHGFLYKALTRGYNAFSSWIGVEKTAEAGVKARILHFGGTIRPRQAKALKTPHGPRESVTIPARPYQGYNAQEEGRDIDAILTAHLQGLAR